MNKEVLQNNIRTKNSSRYSIINSRPYIVNNQLADIKTILLHIEI